MTREATLQMAAERSTSTTVPGRAGDGPKTSARLIPATDAAVLEDWLARSHDETVVLFNYDPYCGGNVRAHRVVSGLERDVVLVDVSRFHGLGAWVAERTGVRHESPQLLVLRDGQAVWHADHGRITAEAVGAALREQV